MPEHTGVGECFEATRQLDIYPGVITKGATFSLDGRYRYSLKRAWGQGPVVAFVGLNPSTADAEQDDPTIRRCIRFARDWGFDGLVMLNLFALRSTDPRALLTAEDPIGPANDDVIAAVCNIATLTVGAWGAFKLADQRRISLELSDTLKNYAVLGRTKDGHPRHPLYMPASARPVGGLFQMPARLPIDAEVRHAA